MLETQGQLAGKVAIITGASKGTGAVMRRQFAAEGTRVRTISQPEDIGNVALFLARNESRTITGQSFIGEAGSIMIG